jgi:hypothetical protein
VERGLRSTPELFGKCIEKTRLALEALPPIAGCPSLASGGEDWTHTSKFDSAIEPKFQRVCKTGFRH